MKNHKFSTICWLLWTATVSTIMSRTFAFSSIHSSSPHTIRRQPPTNHKIPSTSRNLVLYLSNNNENNPATKQDDDDESNNVSCWNPSLRRIMGSVAVLGMSETAFLTYEKITGQVANLCGTDGSCSSVLTGPYATVPFTSDVPLSAVGFLAYTGVAWLALSPLFFTNNNNENDDNNRVALLTLTTTMGTFSTYLMSLLFGILHTSCLYCIASATLSWTLAVSAWLGGAVPETTVEKKTQAVQSSVAGLSTATIAALLLFLSVNVNDPSTMAYAGTNPGISSQLVASAASPSKPLEPQAPPPITQHSSERSLALSQNLNSLDAKMFGAFWCSHCYDQKQTLGFEAMQNIPYVECSNDGVNSQTPLCKSKDVPGYPTWEIGGKLFPGEMELDELEDIVKDLTNNKRK